jgi:hypothetical protein
MSFISTIIQDVARGIVASKFASGGSKTKTPSDYLDELVAERVSLDEYMRTTKVAGKTKGKSFAAKSVSPERGLMTYQRAVDKMMSGRG